MRKSNNNAKIIPSDELQELKEVVHELAQNSLGFLIKNLDQEVFECSDNRIFYKKVLVNVEILTHELEKS
jgi:hypothetical protein